MKMAKASEADLNMAIKLANYLDAIERGYMPDDLTEDSDSSEFIDTSDREQYGRLVDGLKRLLNQGSIFRVIWGMAVVCDPQNKCIDPDAATLEVHPYHVKTAENRDELLEVLQDMLHVMEQHEQLSGCECSIGDAARAAISNAKGGAA